jgi:hypothetical protein
MLVKEKKQRITSKARSVYFLPAVILLSLMAYWLNASGYYHLGPRSKAEQVASQLYHQSIQNYLKSNLENWESYEALETGNLKPVTDSTFVVYHKFRNKNSYGQIIQNNINFYINGRGQVYKIDENY